MAFPDVSFIVCPVHCYNITKDNWYTTEEGINRVLGELSRCGNQFVADLKNYLKWENLKSKSVFMETYVPNPATYVFDYSF